MPANSLVATEALQVAGAAESSRTTGKASARTVERSREAEQTATVLPFHGASARTGSLPADPPESPALTRPGVEVSALPMRRFESLVEELLAEPARTPEILAHAAVETIGPRARAWAEHTRATYPAASPRAVARLAVLRFTRAAGLRGGFGAVAGPYAPIACASAAVFTHAELVLHLAAAFGVDPSDPARAGDLLKLASPGGGPVVAWAVLRLVGRALPGVNVVTGVLGVRATTEMVAVRAQRFYAEYSSQVSQESGSSS